MKLDKKALRELAQLANSERTILSIYINVSQNWDTGEQFTRKQAQQLIPLLNNRERDYFKTSLSFFNDSLQALKSKNIRIPGLAFFADLGVDYTKTIELPVPPRPLLAIDKEAILHPLALIHDEYEPIGVIMIDASGARILITAGEKIESADSLRTKIHHLSKVGGWSQMRYQRRRAKQIQHFSTEIAERATAIFQHEGIKRVVLAGRDRMITALEKKFPQPIQKKIVATVRWDLDQSNDDFVDKIRPILEQTEREQEDSLLKHLHGELRRNGLAIAGIEQTRKALVRGQVDTLFLTEALEKKLTEELVSSAESTASYVEFIPATNKMLEPHEGVAALLRYNI